jgi:hypothetical protein
MQVATSVIAWWIFSFSTGGFGSALSWFPHPRFYSSNQVLVDHLTNSLGTPEF